MIEIKLNKPDNNYIAGETLQGTVVIKNQIEERVRCKYR